MKELIEMIAKALVDSPDEVVVGEIAGEQIQHVIRMDEVSKILQRPRPCFSSLPDQFKFDANVDKIVEIPFL